MVLTSSPMGRASGGSTYRWMWSLTPPAQMSFPRLRTRIFPMQAYSLGLHSGSSQGLRFLVAQTRWTRNDRYVSAMATDAGLQERFTATAKALSVSTIAAHCGAKSPGEIYVANDPLQG